MDSVVASLTDTLNKFHNKSIEFLPSLLAAAVIALAGFALAVILRVVIRRLLSAASFDPYCERLGCTTLLAKADIHGAPSALAGKIVFWFTFLFFLVTGVGALGSELWNTLVAEFFLYLPKLVSAVVILLVGFVAANFLSRATLIASVNADLPSPKILGGMVKALIALLAFSMALDQLGIARGVVTAAFSIVFGAIMLAFAIAFGLGGRHAARRILEARLPKLREKEEDPFSHL